MTSPQLSIAVCDDDPGAALVLKNELVKQILRSLKLTEDDPSVSVVCISDYLKAEDLAATGSLDLLITDLMWPVAGKGELRQGLGIAAAAKKANARTVVMILTAKTDQEKNFREGALLSRSDIAHTWDEALGPGKADLAERIADRLRPSVTSLVPQLERIERATIGLVGLDTVKFSEEHDGVQEGVVKSFLGYMAEAWTVVGPKHVRPIFVFTGDGVFLGLVGDDGPRLALDVGVAAWRQFTSLAGYRTKIAIHAGPVNIATLSTGTQQLLGHSVNWLFRAVNAAAEDGLVVTDEYFSSVLQGGRELVPGLSFHRREAEAKHGRPLVVHDVTATT